IKDAVVNTLSTTQTLPLFSLINKVITIANNDSKDYSEKTMQISKEALTNTINYLETQIPDNNQYILELSKYSEHSTFIESVNKIFYGAPGTGKSHRINEILGSSKYIRTVFYPDMLYSDFVGSLRPRTIEDSEKNKKVIYEYRAGPFLRALILALNSKDEQVYLVIEEINRASASAVFGELFQLLDRNEFGESKYEIDINDPDMLDYINERVNDKLLSLRIPQNLSILATMNSSDQAVMPMDTAFKRRWQFEYMLIDYSNATKGEIPINIYNEDANIETINITWGNFSKILNDELKELNVPEDRLLGHRFLDDNELKTKEKATETVAGKLLVYLWDDVLRHGKKSLIFRTEEFKTFGELHNAFLSGKPIFNDTIEEKIKNFNL
ncbi:AAA domain-containing protein, partial [Salmonella enterica subsp. enterica]|nr:type II restriction endonuclease subunit R [Salmonella enterica]EBZ7102757.1 type II restriction endonuclease subunit R [Salmonella enterica subsp. enterica serovar Albany]EDH5433967.1 type II restriction endonuclease subunit R [Salmonella enterica subsp. enterica serovar Duesseldorf]EDR8002956.1 AAA domain-containing protein [Salmonella enterica subsp. enterica]EKJ5073958.1 AAA family ATPase [Salmonella enterica subsp. enterica serovar Altona]